MKYIGQTKDGHVSKIISLSTKKKNEQYFLSCPLLLYLYDSSFCKRATFRGELVSAGHPWAMSFIGGYSS